MSLSSKTAKGKPVEIDLFGQLLCANLRAFALLRFNTAYYALAAAMHEAEREENPVSLAKVAQVADEQLAWIDDHAPFYEHSTHSCSARHTTSIYTLLGRQARTYARILQVQSRIESHTFKNHPVDYLM